MTNFYKAHKFTAEFEGGYSDHVADRGGVTKYGVSLNFLKMEWEGGRKFFESIGVNAPTKTAIQALTVEQSEQIFKHCFWDRIDGDESQTHVAFLFYDMAVNHGIKNATRIMQRGYNDMMHNTMLVEDGLYGPKTKALLMTKMGKAIILSVVRKRKEFYEAIMANDPSQEVFRNGWVRRANEMGTYAMKLTNA